MLRLAHSVPEPWQKLFLEDILVLKIFVLGCIIKQDVYDELYIGLKNTGTSLSSILKVVKYRVDWRTHGEVIVIFCFLAVYGKFVFLNYFWSCCLRLNSQNSHESLI